MTDGTVKDDFLNLKAGDLIFFSEGKYADYGFVDFFVVLVDIPKRDMHNLAAEVNSKSATGYDAPGMFITSAVQRGWLARIKIQEIWLGDGEPIFSGDKWGNYE